MKTFKEFAVNEAEKEEKNEPKQEPKDIKSFEKNSVEAIKNINAMIEFGRQFQDLDNKQLNPLLEAIKNIHAGEDCIRKAAEVKEEPEVKKEEKTW